MPSAQIAQDRKYNELRAMLEDFDKRLENLESALKRVTAVLRAVPKPAGLNAKPEEKI